MTKKNPTKIHVCLKYHIVLNFFTTCLWYKLKAASEEMLPIYTTISHCSS